MKTNNKLLILGMFFLLLPRIYYHFVSKEGGIISLLAIAFAGIGAILILFSFAKKNNYKFNEIKDNKVFEIMTIYKSPWETRVGISFKNKESQYTISPIPDELWETSCGEKYCKRKNKIVKIN